ncbi:peptidase S24/S26A/S26B/S26C [Diaporthe sp. PMI_573]|nr:peptidase S24/S26A/S26B/S26C [Diaporthaceae sp. PMI_573]
MSSFVRFFRQEKVRLTARFSTPTVRFFLGRYFGRPVALFADAGKVLAAAHLFCTYGYDWGTVSGPSMLPGWSVWGEGAIISHRHRRGKDIKVGDLVRFKIPVNDGLAIKRVLGVAGDYVMMGTPESGQDTMIQVPPGHVWLIGDNLPASRDSRLYGPVPMALIDGKVIARTGAWPWQMHAIENPFDTGHNP